MKFLCLGEGEVSRVGDVESYFDQLTAEASKIVKLYSAYSEPNPPEMCYVSFQDCFLGS